MCDADGRQGEPSDDDGTRDEQPPRLAYHDDLLSSAAAKALLAISLAIPDSPPAPW